MRRVASFNAWTEMETLKLTSAIGAVHQQPVRELQVEQRTILRSAHLPREELQVYHFRIRPVLVRLLLAATLSYLMATLKFKTYKIK